MCTSVKFQASIACLAASNKATGVLNTRSRGEGVFIMRELTQIMVEVSDLSRVTFSTGLLYAFRILKFILLNSKQ
jgi:hypothetical protein